MKDKPCIEFVSYRLKHDTQVEQFLRASQRLEQEFLADAPGVMSRRLLRLSDDDRHWADLIVWTDLDHAQRASANFMAHPACAAFVALLDADSVRMEHYNEIAQFPR